MRLEELLAGVRGTDPGVPTGARGFRGRPRLRELATSPLIVRVALPPAITSGLVNSLLPIFSSADRAAIDAQMWALDSRWLGSGTYQSMRLCVRPRGDVAGGVVSTPLNELPGGCRTPTGAPVDPTCNWGFWKIDKCDLDSASSLVFQFGRYLWAQSRMRDLLATRPTSSTSADVAAAWAWSAAQLISVLWWSTNVRFDNPNAAYPAGNYGTNLRNAGLLMGNPSSNGGIPLIRSQPFDANLGFAYDGPAVAGTPYFAAYPLSPRALNVMGYRPLAPTRQNDFNPGSGPLPFMDRTAAPPTSSYFAMNGNPYLSNIPVGVSPEQAEEIRRLAYSYQSGSTDAEVIRWASTKAFNDWWFRATWSWSTMWRPVPGATGRGKPLVIGGARLIVADLARQLEFYSDASKSYIAWMQSALQTFNLETPIQPTSPAAIDFVNAKLALQSAVQDAARSAEEASRSGTTGTDPNAATITAMVAGIFQAVFTLVAQSVPIIGLLLSSLQQAENLIINAIGGAIGNVPCPAFPFLRVMAPRSGICDLSTTDIVASILGIESHATWPVSIGGQTRTFYVDGRTFTVTFLATDTTADAVARRINAAAALAGLGTVASVRSGQVHVEGRDPGAGAARATGGNAAALGFPGPVSTPPVVSTPAPAPSGTIRCSDGTIVQSGQPCPPPRASSSVLPWAAAAAVALKLLLG